MGIHRKNWDMQSPEKGLHALWSYQERPAMRKESELIEY